MQPVQFKKARVKVMVEFPDNEVVSSGMDNIPAEPMSKTDKLLEEIRAVLGSQYIIRSHYIFRQLLHVLDTKKAICRKVRIAQNGFSAFLCIHILKKRRLNEFVKL